MRVVTQQLARMLTLVLVSGLACACLVRYAPGALVDERELNQHASEETLVAIREQKAQQRNVGVNFVRYLEGLAHGDLGFSESNHSHRFRVAGGSRSANPARLELRFSSRLAGGTRMRDSDGALSPYLVS